jgi:UDP-N-acetylmuramoylalanine--D-glutamate ligase
VINNRHVLPGSTVAIVGLGVSGRSAVRYCLACGARVLISDIRDESQLVDEELQLLENPAVQWQGGSHSLEFLLGADMAIISPGIDRYTELFAELEKNKVEILGELAVVAGQFDVPVVCVTGTNGKTTVTSLIGEVASAAGRKVFVGGNIGTPLYEYFLDDKQYDLVVAELSSFQLESAGNFAPDIALLLNISPDHLKRHRGLKRYIAAKMEIFRNQSAHQLAIINGDDALCQNLDPDFPARFLSFGTGSYNSLIIDDDCLRLNSRVAGERGAVEKICGYSGFTAQNFGAAWLALRELGLATEDIEKGFQDFTTLPHRLEFVAEKNGVRYYNDSKATNSGAVIAALGKMDGPVLLIAGGRDKGDDYGLLGPSVTKSVRLLIVIGEAAGLIEDVLGKVVPTVAAKSMEQAIELASEAAEPGDCVLLSPACASFDMFDNYGHRGDEFKRLVQLRREGE